jgi:hypothetical protein
VAEAGAHLDEHPIAGEGEDQWLATALFGPEPSAAPAAVINRADDAGFLDEGFDAVAAADTFADDPVSEEHYGADHESTERAEVDADPEPVDLDAPSQREPGDTAGVGDANAGSKKTALVLGAGLMAAIAAIVGAFVMIDSPDSPATLDIPTPTAAAAASAAPTSAAPAGSDQDQAVAFTASANCPAGSTSAQALTDTPSDSAWVCVRGAPGGQVDGQVLHVDLGRSYVLSAVSITPGWVAKTPGGKEEWLAHRVVTRLQYMFDDDERTIFTQDTGNTHGPVTTPLPKKVLASRVTVIVLQTSRPSPSPAPTADSAAPAQPGFVDSVLGQGNGPIPAEATQTSQPDPDPMGQDPSDPVDSTFAVSAMKFFGHQPM